MEMEKYVTICQVADARAGFTCETAEQFEAVGLSIFGGCELCHASIAAYNAYPSISGFWRCDDCIDGQGFKTVWDFEVFQVGHGDEVFEHIAADLSEGERTKAGLLHVRKVTRAVRYLETVIDYLRHGHRGLPRPATNDCDMLQLVKETVGL